MKLPLVLVSFCALGISCQGAPTNGIKSESGPTGLKRNLSVDGVAVAGAGLDLRAYVAGMAFVFPDESAEMARSLVRTEMARLEAQRLDIRIPDSRVEDAMDLFSKSLLAQLGADASLDDWSLDRHGSPWLQMRPLYRSHLADNLLYQTVLRADAYLSGRVGLFWYLGADEGDAKSWAMSLRSGRDPKSLVVESLLPGPLADGSFPPMTKELPGIAGEVLQDARIGQVVGPMQLPGDRTWRVGLVYAVFPPFTQLPPVEALLTELEAHPLDALEARAWFEKMSLRYTATMEISPFSGPTQAFELLR